ncbi:methyltransferase family protein [Nocardiopsis sp. Huas11]|uniref:class I SAM-dependent methyltransferase n=1 Tax=Nocardiopsis sp. Huas11 TaxID=2183912 RepID=UPI000EAF9C94|nr:class I SAM-dependent methyltransferase [Nocardiopsis sp. Huas11]RKS10484.1 methyltransferase family protein [Nocardiopsis sp. Huas11]
MTEDWLSANRENWDDRTRVHADSDYYDLPRFREGACTLRDFELAEVGDVSGRSLLHLQCHMGQDTLSWARRGAAVTGLDFTEAAIRTARGLARDIGTPARFVVSDVHEARESLGGERFDIVYTGIGSLVWLPDLTRWADVVADALDDGGFLYLAEFHPLTDVLGADGRSVEEGYFNAGGEVCEDPNSYTDGAPLEKAVSVQWRHSLGEVVTALATAGLRIEFLHEHTATLFQRFPDLRRGDDGMYRFPPERPPIPLMYSLRARQRNVRPSPR